MEHIAWAVGAALFSAVLGAALINGLYELVRVFRGSRTSKSTRSTS
jgi:hypothetical protein